MFVRTNEGYIYDLNECLERTDDLLGEAFCDKWENLLFYDSEVIDRSRNLEDLFDEELVVFGNNVNKVTKSHKYNREAYIEAGYKIYGAIWCDTETKPTLKSVAKYENGEWVLL